MTSRRKVVVSSIFVLAVVIAGVAGLSLTLLKTGERVHAAPPNLPYNTTANGPYTVKGNMIVGTDGKQYMFHGIGRDGLEYNCSGEGPLDKQHLAYMGSGKSTTANETYWGANTVRLPLSEGFWFNGAPGYPCSAQQYRTLIKQTVDNLTALKLNVMLDLHWVDAGRQSGQGGGPWASPDADSVTFWQQISSIYKGYSNVLFELYNEPYPPNWQCWVSGCSYTNTSGYSDDCKCQKTVSYQGVGMQALVDAIRATGAKNLLIAAGMNWGYDLTQLETHLLNGSNIVYDTHPYPYASKAPSTWDQFFGYLSSKYALISAENGQYDCASDYVSQLYDYLDAHQISWVSWAWYAQPSGSASNTCGYPQLVSDYQGTPTIATGQYIYQRLQSYAPSTSTPTPTPTSPSPTPISNGYNNSGISNDTATRSANYDGAGGSYSAQALGADGINPGNVVTANSFAFTWPNVSAATADNYKSVGQTIAVTPVNHADHLGVLGSAVNGATSGTATITYTDNSTQSFTLGFTDWASPNLSFGNSVVASTPYRNTNGGRQALRVYLYSTSVPLQANKTVQSVTLPATTSGGQLHVFALSTSSQTTPVYNNVGITGNGNTTSGNYDTTGNSYSAQALQSVGLSAGNFAFDPAKTVTFTWPAIQAGQADNYQVSGQVIAVTPTTNATLLGFLGSSTNGPTSGTATITYSDGSTQNFTLGFSDWTLNGGKATPSFGNTIAYTAPYRSNPHVRNGQEAVKTCVFYASVNLQAGKTIVSVTLPTTTSGGQLHIFTVTTR